MSKRHLLPLLLFSLGACQQSQSLSEIATPLDTPIELGSRFQVAYAGGIRAGQLASFADSAFASPDGEPDATRPQIEIRSWLLRLSPEAAEQVLPGLGDEGAEGARLMAVESVDTLLDELIATSAGDVLNAPTILCLDERPASVVVENQVAYVEGYDFERKAAQLLVSPRVGVLVDGMQMNFRPHEAAPGVIEMDFAIDVRELQRPIAPLEVPAVPGTQPLTLQLPVFFRQQIQSSFQLQDGEVVVLGPLTTPASDEATFVFVSARIL